MKQSIEVKWNNYGKEYSKEINRKELYEKLTVLNKDPYDESKTLEKVLEAVSYADYIKLEESCNGGNSSGISWRISTLNQKESQEGLIPFLGYHREIFNILKSYFVSEITYKWIQFGKEYQKTLIREYVYDLFLGLCNTFEKENEISKEMIKNLPDIEGLTYNWDSKEIFFFKKDGQCSVIEIGEENTIVIGILDKLAK